MKGKGNRGKHFRKGKVEEEGNDVSDNKKEMIVVVNEKVERKVQNIVMNEEDDDENEPLFGEKKKSFDDAQYTAMGSGDADNYETKEPIVVFRGKKSLQDLKDLVDTSASEAEEDSEVSTEHVESDSDNNNSNKKEVVVEMIVNSRNKICDDDATSSRLTCVSEVSEPIGEEPEDVRGYEEYMEEKRRRQTVDEVFVKLENMEAEVQRRNSCEQSRSSHSSRSLLSLSSLTNNGDDSLFSNSGDGSNSLKRKANELLLLNDDYNRNNNNNSSNEMIEQLNMNERSNNSSNKKQKEVKNQKKKEVIAPADHRESSSKSSSSNFCNEIRNKLKQESNSESNANSKLIFVDIMMQKDVVAIILIRTYVIAEWLSKSNALPFTIPFYTAKNMIGELRQKFPPKSIVFLEDLLKFNSEYPFKSFSMLTKFSPNVEPEVFDKVRMTIMKYVGHHPKDEKNDDKVVELDHRIFGATKEEIEVIVHCVKRYDVRTRNN